MATKKNQSVEGKGVPHPAPPTPLEDQLFPITFFLTGKQRTLVLSSLKQHHKNRAAALLSALHINEVK